MGLIIISVIGAILILVLMLSVIALSGRADEMQEHQFEEFKRTSEKQKDKTKGVTNK